MSAQALLKRFDIVADHSANIPALRRLVVDLAVRGKLLAADELDIDVQEMLDRISSKASELISAGAIKKLKLNPKIGNDEVPSAYLAHCIFARLGNIATLQKGLTGIQSSIPGEFPLVVTAAERGTCDHFDFDAAAAIIPLVSSTGHGNASINRLQYQEGKFALGTILCAVFPFDEQLISARFLYEYLTAFKEELLVSKMIGTANVTLTLGKIAEVPVPILAPAVQRRVDELMALCDQLEAAQQERERRRDRLATVSLQRLNQPAADTTPEAKREHARFHLQNLPRLTTRPEHIKAMRQTILNLAVRGRLVEQDAEDEPAAKLLKRIQVEKARLVEIRSVKGSKPQPETEDMDSSLIPGSWLWTRLVDVGFISPRNTAPDDQLVSFVSMPLIAADYGTPNQHVVRPWREIKTGYTHFSEGDVGLAKITPCFENGKSTVFRGLTNGMGAGTTELHIVRPVLVSADYILIYLKSSLYIASGIPRMTGTAGQKRVPTEYFTQTPFPLPPLAEQHRIVAKVDEIMALCDQLEAQLTTTQTDSRRLLEAILEAALTPA